MPSPTGIIGFSPTVPAAPSGYGNVIPQTDSAFPIQHFSFYRPNVGRVEYRITTTEAIGQAQRGKIIQFTNASAVACTLNTPTDPEWMCYVVNKGVGTVTITPSAGTIGGGATLPLPTSQDAVIFWDGTNYAVFLSTSNIGFATQVGVQDSSYTYAVDSGAANTYVVALAPAVTAYVAGLLVFMKAANANTGASTINVNGLGTQAITKSGSTALTGGEISAGQIVPLQYDGTEFQIIGGGGGGGGGGFTAGGDLSGTSTSQEVIGILSKLIDGTTPTDGQILQYSSGTGKWELLVDRPMFPVSAVGGKPSAGQLVMIYTSAVSLIFPANFASPNSYGTLSVNPTATATYSIYKNGSLVGTVVISTGGAFTFATVGGTSFTMNAGDRLTMVAPGSQDATLQDVGITLACQRSATVSSLATPPIFNYRGTYNGSTAYQPFDVVSYSSSGVTSSYVCIAASTGNLPTNATYWSLFAQGGANGSNGSNGMNGTNGSTWYNGSGVPSSGLGINGDYYLNTANGNVYTKSGGSWGSPIANIFGTVTAAQVQQQSLVFATDTGAANAYAITQSPAPTLTTGSLAAFMVAHANTGASTFNLNAGGAVAVKKAGSTALSSGDWAVGQAVVVMYDGTYWQWIGGGGSGGGGDLTAKYIIGATDSMLTNAAVWPALYNHVDIPPASPNAMNDEFDAATFNATSLWTWRNQSTSTAVQTRSILALTPPAAQGERVIYQAAPATPWAVTAKLCLLGLTSSANAWGGLCVMDSGSTSLLDLQWYPYDQGINVMQLSGNTSYAGAIANDNLNTSFCYWIYMQIEDDGTYLYFRYAFDGINFKTLVKTARKGFLSVNGPNQVGVVVDNWSSYTDAASNPIPILSVDWFRRTL